MEDAEILSLLGNAGTRERAFSLLLDKYQERIYWQVRRMVACHEDAADITQEVWTKVIKYIDGFESKSGLYTWLYRIAHNEGITFVKRQKMKVLRQANLMVQNDVADHIDGEKVWKLLNEGVSTLPEKQRIVFELRYFEEMPYRDISELLGTTVGGLKASYHIAAKKIESYVKTVFWT